MTRPHGHPDTIGSNKDGQENPIFKKITSKDDQMLRKSLQVFLEPLQRGRHPYPCKAHFILFSIKCFSEQYVALILHTMKMNN
jgi:hypothetical protein